MSDPISFRLDADVEEWVKLYLAAYGTPMSRLANNALRMFFRSLAPEVLEFIQIHGIKSDEQTLKPPKHKSRAA